MFVQKHFVRNNIFHQNNLLKKIGNFATQKNVVPHEIFHIYLEEEHSRKLKINLIQPL